MRPKHLCVCVVLLFSLASVAVVHAQRQAAPKPLPPGNTVSNGTILVDVFAQSGTALDSDASVVATAGDLGGPVSELPEQISRTEWRFRGLTVGTEYVIRIAADGYETKVEHVTIPPFDNAMVHIRVYLVPVARPANTFSPPPGHFLLSPRAQHEVQQAIKDLKSAKFSAARKHLGRALKIAPNHPGVNYLMGLSYLRDHQAGKAIPYLEKSMSIDPSQLPALLALGIAHYDQGDYGGAIDLLNRAVAGGLSSWQAEWILAGSYLREKNYEQARQHAEKALKTGKKEARQVQMVLGEALAGLGERQQAVKAFETFLKQNRHDPAAGRVRAALEKLREAGRPAAPAASGRRVPATGNGAAPDYTESGGKNAAKRTPPAAAAPPLARPAPPPALVPSEDWAPPDVDAVELRVISNRACPLPLLLKRAGQTAVEWVKDLQKFAATEEYQSVEIGRHGKVGTPFEQKFEYLVFIEKPRPHVFAVQELRQPQPNLSEMGAPIVALGSPALALVFHPNFVHDYRWTCEGLGEWKQKPAWIVRFAQRTDRPTTTLQSFEDPTGSHLLELKGLAWLSEKGDHVMHLETDLLKPVPAIRLEREHFSIDYRLVAFRSHPVKLWLPESVDLYILYRGHAYHNYSHYSHFQLFWTGVAQTIGVTGRKPPPE